MIVVSDTSPITALLAVVLLQELDAKAGIYLTDELKNAALKTVGE
jgi:hypothetical protein